MIITFNKYGSQYSRSNPIRWPVINTGLLHLRTKLNAQAVNPIVPVLKEGFRDYRF